MRKIDTIVIHCAATRPSMDVGAREIDQWHRARGFKCIGYHFVIRRNGKLEKGRPVEQVGAHVAGHNTNSIGICLVGGVSQKDFTKAENNFTAEQWPQLIRLIKDLKSRFDIKSILGHNELDKNKACPSFSVKQWLKDNPL